MPWLDNLFAPPMFGQSGLVPNSYDYFRALYPPHTRDEPPAPPSLYGPRTNPSLMAPQTARPPIEPRDSGFPGFAPQMTGDVRVGEGEPTLPAGEMPWLSMAGRFMTGGADPTLRINRPNVVPAGGQPARSPPMMGNAPDMAMWNIPTPDSSAAPSGPNWGERNKGWLEPLGDALTGLGQGIAATPPGSSPLTYLSQGTAMGAQNIERAQDRKLDRRLKEAQVGKAEQDTDMRRQAIALGKELPAGHPAKKYFQMGMVKEGLEKIDPDYNKLIIVGPDGKPQINEMAVRAQSAVRAAGQPVVNVALPKAETAAGKLLNDITRIKEQLTKDPENPTLKAALRTAETSLKNEGITEGMRKASGFASRAERSEQSLESLAGKGYDTPSLWDQMTAGGGWKNFMASGKGQQYMQAARDWIGAILRYDSGAAVPDTEFARYFQAYFPQPGDDAATVAQKRAARQGIINELKSQSGGAYETYFPEGARKPATNSGRTKSGWTYEKMP